MNGRCNRRGRTPEQCNNRTTLPLKIFEFIFEHTKGDGDGWEFILRNNQAKEHDNVELIRIEGLLSEKLSKLRDYSEIFRDNPSKTVGAFITDLEAEIEELQDNKSAFITAELSGWTRSDENDFYVEPEDLDKYIPQDKQILKAKLIKYGFAIVASGREISINIPHPVFSNNGYRFRYDGVVRSKANKQYGKMKLVTLSYENGNSEGDGQIFYL